ncbi:MAG: YihY/virulence factor BrkB family protein [Planctomycetaceae bacterium]|nr:YihY/virulence factor BrkB family protein [Planctomycetaceae bacterium]
MSIALSRENSRAKRSTDVCAPSRVLTINARMINDACRRAGCTQSLIGISFVTLLFGASGLFGQLQTALNTIWGVKSKPDRGIRGIVRDRFLSFVMVMGMAFLLLASLIVAASIAMLGSSFGNPAGSLEWIAQAVNLGVSFSVITLLFALMFKLLPDVRIAWSDVWLGAVLTAALFTIGKSAIGAYLGRSSMASSYGVAASFVVLLVWVYYSAQILFFGAELTQVYANQFGSRIVPDKNAEPLNTKHDT